MSKPRATPKKSHVLQGLAISFVLPMAVLLVLAALDVPLGERAKLFYRYSPWRPERAFRALPALLVLLPLTVFVVRRASAARLALFLIAIGAWTIFAPPLFVGQHLFNFISPAQDGAFVLETLDVRDARSYLHGFDQRVQRSVMESNGSRVISNPPGVTLLAHALSPTKYDPADPIHRLIREQMNEREQPLGVTGIRLGIVLELAWLASGFIAYAIGRLYFQAPGAALFAIIVTSNPATVHFTPGKDSGQLLLINLMMWTWLAGWKRSDATMLIASGIMLTIASTFTLIAIWVAMILFIACAWETSALKTIARRTSLALLGVIVAVVLIYLTLDWNLPATIWTISRRFGGIQRELGFNRPLWFAIGMPIFLLFVSPAIWTLGALRARRLGRRIKFGERMLITTLAIMLITYIVGVQYEIPRLWIAFWPPLVLGLMRAWPVSFAKQSTRAARLLATIAAVHVAFTIAHWTMLDAREAEHRLMQKTIFKLD